MCPGMSAEAYASSRRKGARRARGVPLAGVYGGTVLTRFASDP